MGAVENLAIQPVWVAPNHLVSSALLLLRGHSLRAVAVLDGEKPVGILTLESAVSADPSSRVGDAMSSLEPVLDADADIRDAARMFVEQNLEYAAVLKNGHFVGMLQAVTLLQELGKSWDPMTGLPWSDVLRSWGAEQLRAGEEITILFIDLNDFGAYNKRHGHVVGDRILKEVANLLVDTVAIERDVVVRYGGDEFAIGTLKLRDSADEMLEHLEEMGRSISVDGIEESVSFSVGIAGGRRTDEREEVHYQATVDNLINLASRDCLGRKTAAQAERAIEEVSEKIQQELSIVAVSVSGSKPSSTCTVSIKAGANRHVAFDVLGTKPALYSVAQAACNALGEAFPGTRFEAKEVLLTDEPGGTKTVTVSVVASIGGAERIAGASVPAGSHVYGAAAQAVLNAASDLPLPAPA